MSYLEREVIEIRGDFKNAFGTMAAQEGNERAKSGELGAGSSISSRGMSICRSGCYDDVKHVPRRLLRVAWGWIHLKRSAHQTHCSYRVAQIMVASGLVTNSFCDDPITGL